MQTDGYSAYDDIGGPKLVHVGCWAHARRKFVDAVKVNAKDAEAVKMVLRMDALFVVDREARKQALNGTECLALRRSRPRNFSRSDRQFCAHVCRMRAWRTARPRFLRIGY